MSEKIYDGGPAFPTGARCATHHLPNGDKIVVEFGGIEQAMSLRVWLAGRAVTGLCAGTLTPDMVNVLATAAKEKGIPPETAIADSVADMAYNVADAMLRRSTR